MVAVISKVGWENIKQKLLSGAFFVLYDVIYDFKMPVKSMLSFLDSFYTLNFPAV